MGVGRGWGGAQFSLMPVFVKDLSLCCLFTGWKRELVLRGVFDERTSSGTKRKNPPADVYYFTPEGRKLVSISCVFIFLLLFVC